MYPALNLKKLPSILKSDILDPIKFHAFYLRDLGGYVLDQERLIALAPIRLWSHIGRISLRHDLVERHFADKIFPLSAESDESGKGYHQAETEILPSQILITGKTMHHRPRMIARDKVGIILLEILQNS